MHHSGLPDVSLISLLQCKIFEVLPFSSPRKFAPDFVDIFIILHALALFCAIASQALHPRHLHQADTVLCPLYRDPLPFLRLLEVAPAPCLLSQAILHEGTRPLSHLHREEACHPHLLQQAEAVLCHHLHQHTPLISSHRHHRSPFIPPPSTKLLPLHHLSNRALWASHLHLCHLHPAEVQVAVEGVLRLLHPLHCHLPNPHIFHLHLLLPLLVHHHRWPHQEEEEETAEELSWTRSDWGRNSET